MSGDLIANLRFSAAIASPRARELYLAAADEIERCHMKHEHSLGLMPIPEANKLRFVSCDQGVSEEFVLEKLRSMITYDCKIKDLAARFQVSPAFMSMVLSGKRQMTAPMLEAVGVKRKVTYFEEPN